MLTLLLGGYIFDIFFLSQYPSSHSLDAFHITYFNVFLHIRFLFFKVESTVMGYWLFWGGVGLVLRVWGWITWVWPQTSFQIGCKRFSTVLFCDFSWLWYVTNVEVLFVEFVQIRVSSHCNFLFLGFFFFCCDFDLWTPKHYLWFKKTLV